MRPLDSIARGDDPPAGHPLGPASGRPSRLCWPRGGDPPRAPRGPPPARPPRAHAPRRAGPAGPHPPPRPPPRPPSGRPSRLASLVHRALVVGVPGGLELEGRVLDVEVAAQ